MAIWTSLYEESATNAEIAAGGTAFEDFFSSAAAKDNIAKHKQSFNALEINNDSTEVLHIQLDNLSTRQRTLFSKSSITINPEDGIFFNSVRVVNTDTANAVSASEVRLNARILKPVREK